MYRMAPFCLAQSESQSKKTTFICTTFHYFTLYDTVLGVCTLAGIEYNLHFMITLQTNTKLSSGIYSATLQFPIFSEDYKSQV